MSFDFSVQSGNSLRLKTEGKYCDRDIVVTAYGGEGGTGLPPLEDAVEGGAEDLVAGKKLYNDQGAVVVGTNPYEKTTTDTVVANQGTLLDQALAAIAGKAAGSGSGSVVEPLNATPSREQQTFTPSGFDGYAPVIIEAIPDSYVQPSGTKSITTNGTHDVSSFASVDVNVSTTGGSGDLDDVIVVESGESFSATFHSVERDGIFIYARGKVSKDTLFKEGSMVTIAFMADDIGL